MVLQLFRGMAPCTTGPKPEVLTPAVLELSKLLKLKIPEKIDQCLADIERFFKTAMPKCSRMDMIVALSDLYVQEDFIGPKKAPHRIVLHFLIFLSHGYKGYINEQIWTFHYNTGISPAIAVLLKCYGTPNGARDSVFANMTNAERQFIGRLIGYTSSQRRMFLNDETPRALSEVKNDDPHISAASALIREHDFVKRTNAMFKNINTCIKLFQFMIASAKKKEDGSDCFETLDEQRTLQLFAEDIVPLDAVPCDNGDIGEDNGITWSPVPPGLLDLPYDAAVVYAPHEYVERLQREHDALEAQKKASAEAAANVAAEEKRQAEAKEAKNKAHHQRAKTMHEQTLAQIAKEQFKVPPPPLPSVMINPAMFPPPEHSPMMVSPLHMQHPPPMHQGFFPPPAQFNPAAMMEMQAHQQMQAAYFAGMGPANRKIPCISVPPGFAPMMPFPPPQFNPAGDGFRVPPPPLPSTVLSHPLTIPPPPLPAPLIRTAPASTRTSPDPKPIAPPVDTKPSGPRKPTMSEVVKRNLTPPKKKEEKKDPAQTMLDGFPSGDSNIEECYDKVMALVATPFPPFLGQALWPGKDPPKLEKPEDEPIKTALRCVFEGDVAAIRHEHLEIAKTFFEGCNYAPLKEIKVTNERLIELITINPNAMGVCLAYMLRSGDEFVFDFISELISGNFCPMTVVVLVRFVVENFRHCDAYNNKTFIDTVISTCLTYLNDPIIQEMRTSVEGRLVRLVVTLLYMHVLYIPDVVEHRMDELLAMTSCYSSLRFAISIYHAITNYRKKKAARGEANYAKLASGIKS
uniref:ENTH domain-containing protein n=1 Tax=Panagrellus redivivus TaxID=6233 RepID=A0A7E4ZUF7_PANRE